MNWIGKWCRERCEHGKDCNECSEVCIPRFRLSAAVGCSEYLIWLLMFGDGNTTQHNIADRIADYIGASAEERDSIVSAEHRGTYIPNPNRRFNTTEKTSSAWNAKPVVAIDRLGFVIARYPSLEKAADSIGCEKHPISIRCNKIGPRCDEFKSYGMSFRFEDEWEALTPEERIKDINEQKERYI